MQQYMTFVNLWNWVINITENQVGKAIWNNSKFDFR